MNEFELVHSGEDYFQKLCDMIANAQDEIHLQTYIFDDDSTGLLVADALKKAVSRDVKVFVLLDAYGSSSLSDVFINDLKASGINIRFFSPFFSINNLYLGRRLHHKVVVVDANTAMVGGINIADKYRGDKEYTAWLDYAVKVKGSAAHSLMLLCQSIFHKKTKLANSKLLCVFKNENNDQVRILRNDWLKRKAEISRSYLNALKEARQEIIIVGSYFFPGKRFLRRLKKATLTNGVKVKLILSENVDVPLVESATRHLYHSLFKSKVEIYKWKKSVLHGKVAVADQNWTTIGSFNLNHLSVYGSVELNMEIQSRKFGSLVTSELERVISQCEFLSEEDFKQKYGVFTKVLDFCSYAIMRLSSLIMTYLPYKRAFSSFYNAE